MHKSMIVIACVIAAAVALPSLDDEVVPEEELVGATCNCCGKTYPKPSCSITLYQHCNYHGYGINLAPGSYNMHTLIRKGMKNDDLSAVRIHGSCRAILYQHWNFGGRVMIKDRDDSCFTNDRMLIPVSELHQIVVKHKDDMEEDDEEQVNIGRKLLGRRGDSRRRAVSWNDQISSAKVQDRAAAAHSCASVCKAPCAAEKSAKATEKQHKTEEKTGKIKEKAAKAKEKADKTKEKAAKAEKAEKKAAELKKKAAEKAAKAKAEKSKKEKKAKAEKAAKKEKAEKAKEKAEKAKEKAEKAKEKADKEKADKAEKKNKEVKKKAAEKKTKEVEAKKKEKAEKKKAKEAAKKAKEAKGKKEKKDKAAEKKAKIPPPNPCKKYELQEAANKAMTKTLQKQVKFKPNKWELLKAGKTTLDVIAGYLIKYQWMELDLEGHSTASGSYCKKLTKNRASTAADYLKKKGCSNKIHTSGKCKTFIGLKIKATGTDASKPPLGCSCGSKGCKMSWKTCAQEHSAETCHCIGAVKYGKGSKWTKPKKVSSTIQCNNRVFGDPLHGTVKECQCSGVTFKKCANEHGTCKCKGTVKYGKGTKWATKKANGSIKCSNSVFGDPLYGTVKECQCGA